MWCTHCRKSDHNDAQCHCTRVVPHIEVPLGLPPGEYTGTLEPIAGSDVKLRFKPSPRVSDKTARLARVASDARVMKALNAWEGKKSVENFLALIDVIQVASLMTLPVRESNWGSDWVDDGA